MLNPSLASTPGRVAARADRAVARADRAVARPDRAVVIILTNLLTLLGILAVLLIWDWRLGLVYLGLLHLIALGMWAYARRVRPAWMRVQRQLAALTCTLQESLAGILVVKLFGREAFEQKRADRQSRSVLQANSGLPCSVRVW
jgi:subfamily B ATP-binding cassette protein MsbA